MQNYQSLNGESGVSGYEIGSDSIKIQFSDGDTYLYTYQSAGRENIERMKELAAQGSGLSTFINQNKEVKQGFAAKLN